MLKPKRLIVVLGIILLGVCAAAVFIPKQYVVPIIMYHSVHPDNKPENRLGVSAQSFERQMRFLKQQRYNVLPLEELTELIRQHKKIPAKTVAITFDDGYRDNYIYAFPVLKKYSLPATIFIIVNEVGRKKGDRLDWQQIKQMQASSLITVGSHALGPEPLVNIRSEKELRRQIFDSKRALEEKLVRPVNAFSYAGGAFNPQIRKLVMDAGYKVAVATNPGKKYPKHDLFGLKRLRISSSSDNLFVFWIEISGFYTFIKERRDKD